MSAAMMLLRQDVAHAAKIREHLTYQARGDDAERAEVVRQIDGLLGEVAA